MVAKRDYPHVRVFSCVWLKSTTTHSASFVTPSTFIVPVALPQIFIHVMSNKHRKQHKGSKHVTYRSSFYFDNDLHWHISKFMKFPCRKFVCVLSLPAVRTGWWHTQSSVHSSISYHRHKNNHVSDRRVYSSRITGCLWRLKTIKP